MVLYRRQYRKYKLHKYRNKPRMFLVRLDLLDLLTFPRIYMLDKDSKAGSNFLGNSCLDPPGSLSGRLIAGCGLDVVGSGYPTGIQSSHRGSPRSDVAAFILAAAIPTVTIPGLPLFALCCLLGSNIAPTLNLFHLLPLTQSSPHSQVTAHYSTLEKTDDC